MKYFLFFFELIICSNNDNTLRRACKHTESFFRNAINKFEDMLRPSKIAYTRLENSDVMYKPRSASDGQITFTSRQNTYKKDKRKKSVISLQVFNELKLNESPGHNFEDLDFNMNIDTQSIIDIETKTRTLDDQNNVLSKQINQKEDDIEIITKNPNSEKNTLSVENQLIKFNQIEKYFEISQKQTNNSLDSPLSTFLRHLHMESFFINKEFKLEIIRNELFDNKKMLHQFNHNVLHTTEQGYVDMTSKIIKTILLKINIILISCYSMHHYLILCNNIYYQNISEKLELEKFKQQYDKVLNEYFNGKSLTINLVVLEKNIYKTSLILKKCLRYFIMLNKFKNESRFLLQDEKDFMKHDFKKIRNFIDDEIKYVEMF